MEKWNLGRKAGNRVGKTGGSLFCFCLCMCICNVSLLCLFFRLLVSGRKRLVSLQREREVLLQEQSYRKQYLQMIQRNERKLRQLRQGLQEDFEGLLGLMEAGEDRRVLEILRGKREIVKEVSSFVDTRSMVANAAMNKCFSRAARHHIRITSMVPEDFEGIEEYDLSSLLTNMLDNAIEGCLQVPVGEERTMHLEITAGEEPGRRDRGQMYIFRTENTSAGRVVKNNPTLATTKKEKENHGYGTGIIRDIARKYNGNAEFFDGKDTFCCRVVLFGKPLT